MTYIMVCNALVVALTGRNVTSAAGSRMKDKTRPTQKHTLTHTSEPEKDVTEGQRNSKRERGCPLL